MINGFTIGIEDDVTHLSLPADESFQIEETTLPACSGAWVLMVRFPRQVHGQDHR